MKKIVRITENKLNRIIVESVKRILKEDIVDHEFAGHASNEGSFVESLYKAHLNADPENRTRIEKAFPEYFNQERMYGNEKDPFDYRSFPFKYQYDKHWDAWQRRNHPEKFNSEE